MVGICQEGIGDPRDLGREAVRGQWRSAVPVFDLSSGSRTRSVTRHSYAGSCWHNARRRRLSYGQPAGPKTVNAAESLARLAESRLSGVRGEPGHNGCGRCAPSKPGLHSDESGRLFLSGLVATRARLRFTGSKKANHLDRSACLRKRKTQARAAVSGGAKSARSAASR